MVDMNSMPTGYEGNNPVSPQSTPSYLKPGAATTPMGGVSNMVKALMEGYQKGQARNQARQDQAWAPAQQMANQAGATPLAPSSQGFDESGFAGFAPQTAPNPMAVPAQYDPSTMSALFSQPPGVGDLGGW